MAKTNLTLDTRKALKDGTFPIKMSIYIDRTKRIVFSIGIYVKKDEWDGRQIIRTPRKAMLNNYLRSRLNAIDDEMLKLEMTGEVHRLTTTQIKKRLLSTFDPTEEDKPNATLIESAFIEFANGCKADMTKSIYLQTLSKLRATFDMSTLCFADITNKWLRDWENTMLNDGLSVNGLSVHLRNLRAVFNRAIDDDVISQEIYPFRKFKIKSERTAKRSLSVDDLRLLMDYPCEPYQCKYRDYFMLIFYLMGINLVDLSRLTTIENGRIEYKRAKTGRLYSIKVEPEALSIIERYKGKNQLVDISDRTSDYHNFLARMNEGLKSIGEVEYVANSAKNPLHIKKNKKEIKPLFPNISTYWARHTWATIAASLDIPKETIAAALGHGQNSITDIYIDFDQRKVDEANRKVIDYLL